MGIRYLVEAASETLATKTDGQTDARDKRGNERFHGGGASLD